MAYFSQSSRAVEHSNRAIKDELATLVLRTPQWPMNLPSVHLALNTALHRSVGDQPLYLLGLFTTGLTNVETVGEGLIVDA